MRLRSTLFAAGLVALTACGTESRSGATSRIDSRLQVHALTASTPTVETAAYLAAVTAIHDQVKQASSDDEAIAVLRRGLALPVPGGLGEGDVVRLELGHRLGEILARQPGGAVVALEVLSPMLHPDRSLPLDSVTAQALVLQGDLAVQVNDPDLAVSSYSRAIRLLSMLREELEP